MMACRYEDLEKEKGVGIEKAKQGMDKVPMQCQWVLTNIAVSYTPDEVLVERAVAPWHIFNHFAFDGFIQVGHRNIGVKKHVYTCVYANSVQGPGGCLLGNTNNQVIASYNLISAARGPCNVV